MKTTVTMLKAGLVGLFLITYSIAQSQSIDKRPQAAIDVGPETPQADPGRQAAIAPVLFGGNEEYETINAVLFYKPESGPTMTLVASLVEDHETRVEDAALDFTMYKWFYMGQDGSAAVPGYGLPAEGQDKTVGLNDPANEYAIPTGLSPGYHYFAVQGFITPDGVDEEAICPPGATETFVVYVLPPLSVTTTHTGIDELLQYCELNAATQGNVQITATVNYEDPYIGPPAIENEFELKFTWYAVKSNDVDDVFSTTTFPPIDDSKVNITGATAQEVNVDGDLEAIVVSNTYEFTPTIAEIGTYKFFVEVEYTVKDRAYDVEGEDDLENRARPYAIFRQWFGGDGESQADASIVYVTPQPGKPHITIEAVND